MKKVFCNECVYYEKELSCGERCHAPENQGNYLDRFKLRYLPSTNNSDSRCSWFKTKCLAGKSL